jgi:hypothetical protein
MEKHSIVNGKRLHNFHAGESGLVDFKKKNLDNILIFNQKILDIFLFLYRRNGTVVAHLKKQKRKEEVKK